MPPRNPQIRVEISALVILVARHIRFYFSPSLSSRDYLRPRPDSPLTRGVWTLPWKTAPPSPVTLNISAPTTTCSLSAEKRIPPRGSVIRKPLDTQSTRSSPAKWTKDTPFSVSSKRAPRRGEGEEEEEGKYLWVEGRKFVKSRGIGNHVFSRLCNET